MQVKGNKSEIGNEVLKLGEGLGTKGFGSQRAFRFNLTFNKNLLKCSEGRVCKILFTFLK